MRDAVRGAAWLVGAARRGGAARVAGAAAVAELALAFAGEASAAPLALDARLGATGWIDLTVTGRAGTTVAVTEEGAPVADVLLRTERAERRRAAQWTCDRSVRRFEATAPAEAGGTETATAEVRTPGCRQRLAIATRPFAPRRGRRLLVRVRDHWRLGGVEARVCLRRTCRTARIRSGRATTNIRLRARRAGIQTVTATAPWGQRAKRIVEVRRRPLTVLA
ncbi:MAG TPA: hypothetical protein VGW10_08640, partial [Solirubrobacteraceae bacterium]|nr:hypothetical protein [Solirubrobacteraceae bacterium]